MKPHDAIGQDMRHVGQSLDIVDVGRLAKQAVLGRKRRLGTRIRAPPFEAVEQGGFFAKDVAPGTAMHVQFDIKTGTKNVPAQVTGCNSFLNRPLNPL